MLVTAAALLAATLGECVVGEAWATGLPRTTHVVATRRAVLTRAGVQPIAALATVPVGATVTVAGLAIGAPSPSCSRSVVCNGGARPSTC